MKKHWQNLNIITTNPAIDQYFQLKDALIMATTELCELCVKSLCPLWLKRPLPEQQQ